MITIPLLPALLKEIETKYPRITAGQDLNNQISAYFSGCMGVGEAVAPPLASIFTVSFGFRTSYDGLATVVLTFAILFFIICGNFRMLSCMNEEKEVDDDFKSVNSSTFAQE